MKNLVFIVNFKLVLYPFDNADPFFENENRS